MSRIIHRLIFISLIACLAGFPVFAKPDSDKKFTVVIDAGHGGKDIGATDNGLKEKDINLKVAKQLESLIKKKMKNTNVVMTRDNDSFLTLQERVDKANNAQGDIFVSIHTNSVDKRNRNRKNIAGSSVYTLGLHKDENNLEVAMRENSVIELESNYEQKYSGFDPQRDESYIIFEMAQKKNLSHSIQLADLIEKELVASGRENRGVHQAGFWVLWATSMPSVLIELDFICNPSSAKYMGSDKGAKELAEAIFKAIQKYEDSWNKSNKNLSTSEVAGGYSYSDDSESPFEDTYVLKESVPVAKAKTRVHNPVKTPKTYASGERRRRSAASKALSLNNSYESDKIVFQNPVSYGVLAMKENTGENLPDLSAPVASDDKSSKNNKKKADKNKQKEEKAKKSEEKKKKKRKEDSYNAKVNKLVTVYKIQILASTDLLNQGNPRFCGLSPITAFKENNLYKYYYGESTDREELESVLADVKKKIPDAFIVASRKTVQTNK